MLIDAHNHLQDRRLAPRLGKIAQSLAPLGPPQMMVNGMTVEDWDAVERLAARYPWVIPNYGLHPWFLAWRPTDWESQLRARLEADPRAGIGETGVDRWMAEPDVDAQQEVLRGHLALAREFDRPMTIHCLRAWEPLLEALRASPPPGRGFLMHAFGGSREIMERLVGWGAFFSFNPSFLAEGREKKRAVYREIPSVRLLVETDAPAMPPPVAWRQVELPPAPDGTTLSHPANLLSAYEGLAQIRGLSREALERQIEENFVRFTQARAPSDALSPLFSAEASRLIPGKSLRSESDRQTGRARAGQDGS